jgi:hypothetical protein
MTAALAPRVRLMAICDGVRESKIEAGVFNLKGVRQGITALAFPLPAELRLFLVLSCPRAGEFPGSILVTNSRTEKAIFIGKLEPKPRFEGDDAPWTSIHRIRCKFPEEGRYTVQVCFFQERGSDIVKGEMPFIVASEGF